MIRIMTSNIWGDYFHNPTVGRDNKLYGVYQKYSPDVLGFQEVTRGWYESSLFQKLSDEYYFVGTELFHSKNFVPMAIKKELAPIAGGFEYLENTPDASKAITWCVVKRGETVFAVCNTHFWWMRGNEPEQERRRKNVFEYTLEDHCRIRSDNAAQLARLMKYIEARFSCPVFAFGDMNATVEEGVFRVYEQNHIQKLFDMTEQKDTACSLHGNPIKDEKGVFHGTRATAEYVVSFRRSLCLPEAVDGEGNLTSIDHIIGLGDSFKVWQYRVVEDQDALDATDHSPVYADVELLSE